MATTREEEGEGEGEDGIETEVEPPSKAPVGPPPPRVARKDIGRFVHKLDEERLRLHLSKLGCETRGLEPVLQRRLKHALRRQHDDFDGPKQRRPRDPVVDLYCVLDFEATCEQSAAFDAYPHEIIEFPIVLVDGRTGDVVDTFRTYCRPTCNATLTDFCTTLTGIAQAVVDSAPAFPDAMALVAAWMTQHGLPWREDFDQRGREGHASYVFVTDGPWDFQHFFTKQWALTGGEQERPPWTKRWVNLRKTFCNYYDCKPGNIDAMLGMLGLSFQGKPHSGLDDAQNIARILAQLLQDGAQVKINDKLHAA